MATDSKNGSSIRLEVRDDGVYAIINNTNLDKVTRKDVLTIVEDCQLEDVDFKAINEIFKNPALHIETKLTGNTKIAKKNEEVIIEINNDASEAHMTIKKPGLNGDKKDFDQLMAEIGRYGVRHGINEAIVRRIAFEKEYDKSYIIAQATPPESGEDGYLEYKFDIAKKNKAPKILEDGRVDYHDLDMFECVYEGQELVVAHPPHGGKDGINVLGQPIPFKQGKPAPKFRYGKNVEVVGDNEKLVSRVNGQIVFHDKKVSVSPVMEIQGDVGNSTGNINFNGSVLVRGNVLSGFSVVSDDEIEVMGSVEGAIITSGMDVKIYGGIHGLEKAVITAGGDINAKFAESCTLIANGDIIAGNILHSNVSCGGNLVVNGKKGMLAGGKVTAGKNVKAKVIGSTMATQTEINIGSSPNVFDKYEAIKKEISDKKEEYKKLSVMCESLIKLNDEGKLDKAKKDILLKSLHARNFLKEKIKEQNEIMEKMVMPWLGENKSAVYASDVIRSGVRVLIGGAVLHVKDDIYSCKLSNKDDKVVIDSYTGG